MSTIQKQNQIPKDWREVKLGGIGVTYGGLTGKDKDDFGDGKPFVSYMDVYNSGAIRTLPPARVRVADGERQNLVRYGDVIFTTSSETADEVGTASVFLVNSSEQVFLNSFCFGLRMNRGVLLPEYAKFFFRTMTFRREMTRIAQGATRYNLSKTHFLQTGVALPPLPEQKRIVKVLEAWDRAVEVLRRKIELKKEIKKGLMQELLTGKTRLPGFSGEWNNVPISSFASLVTKLNISDKKYEVLSCTKYHGLVRSLEYFDRRVYGVDLTKYKIVPKSCFVYATNHIEEGSIGHQNLLDFGLVSPMYTVFKTKKVNNDFLFGLLKMPRMIFEYQRHMSASVERRGGLRWTEFSKIMVRLPSEKEQDAIANTLLVFSHEISILEKKLALLEDQKKYLLNTLITGAIRTPEYLK